MNIRITPENYKIQKKIFKKKERKVIKALLGIKNKDNEYLNENFIEVNFNQSNQNIDNSKFNFYMEKKGQWFKLVEELIGSKNFIVVRANLRYSSFRSFEMYIRDNILTFSNPKHPEG